MFETIFLVSIAIVELCLFGVIVRVVWEWYFYNKDDYDG